MTQPVCDEITVVCYDIAEDRRRYRAVRILEGYGTRAQESVFECWLLPSQRRELRRKLEAVVDPEADRMAFYTLAAKDADDVVLLGRGARLAENITSVVI